MAAAAPADLATICAPFDWRPPTPQRDNFQPDVLVFRKSDADLLGTLRHQYAEMAKVTGDETLAVDFPFPVTFTPAELMAGATGA